MYEKISTNIKVLGLIASQMRMGKTEFSIIVRETIDGINFYKGLLDNGTVCPVTRENDDYIAHDIDCDMHNRVSSFIVQNDEIRQ